MIDQISIRNVVNAKTGFTQVRVWIGGIPFSADLTGDAMERTIIRIAKATGLEVVDTRSTQAQATAT